MFFKIINNSQRFAGLLSSVGFMVFFIFFHVLQWDVEASVSFNKGN